VTVEIMPASQRKRQGNGPSRRVFKKAKIPMYIDTSTEEVEGPPVPDHTQSDIFELRESADKAKGVLECAVQALGTIGGLKGELESALHVFNAVSKRLGSLEQEQEYHTMRRELRKKGLEEMEDPSCPVAGPSQMRE
jgi:hypothetical protein